MPRAALEGALVLTFLGGLASALAAGWARAGLWRGLGLAWVAGTLGTLALAWGQARSSKWFWRAFGFGATLRGGVLLALIAANWKQPWQEAGVLCGAYVVGLTAVMLLEFRHLVKGA